MLTTLCIRHSPFKSVHTWKMLWMAWMGWEHFHHNSIWSFWFSGWDLKLGLILLHESLMQLFCQLWDWPSVTTRQPTVTLNHPFIFTYYRMKVCMYLNLFCFWDLLTFNNSNATFKSFWSPFWNSFTLAIALDKIFCREDHSCPHILLQSKERTFLKDENLGN